ncbi:hypothetical protein CJF32_00000281 [Rutstroemia sp. NJR-2017a WRK4]|nr:hypothetical protein CJF32_00000281 [Rutstroemia sp. NJR-2017a WRK4]
MHIARLIVDPVQILRGRSSAPGAASGIGLAVTRQLILDGVLYLALIDVSSDALTKAQESLSEIVAASKEPVHLLLLPTNCAAESEVDLAVQQTVEKFGRLDICFNGAGIAGSFGHTADATAENLGGVLDVNLKGVYFCEKAQLKQMLKQDLRDVCTGLPLQTRGAIVNVGSIASHSGLIGAAPYVMAKHGVLGLTRTDSATYASQGIRVNCLCPGWITTPMSKNVQENEAYRTPVGRFGLPEEVAYMASFLLSDRASFVNGSEVSVDGGWSAT